MATILKELTPENISSNYTLSTIKKVNDTIGIALVISSLYLQLFTVIYSIYTHLYQIFANNSANLS